MLAEGQEIGSNGGEGLGALDGAEATGDLLLELRHAEVALGSALVMIRFDEADQLAQMMGVAEGMGAIVAVIGSGGYDRHLRHEAKLHG